MLFSMQFNNFYRGKLEKFSIDVIINRDFSNVKVAYRKVMIFGLGMTIQKCT